MAGNIIEQLDTLQRRTTRIESRLVKLATELGIDINATPNMRPVDPKTGDAVIAIEIDAPSVTLSALANVAARQGQQQGVAEVYLGGRHVADVFLEDIL